MLGHCQLLETMVWVGFWKNVRILKKECGTLLWANKKQNKNKMEEWIGTVLQILDELRWSFAKTAAQ